MDDLLAFRSALDMGKIDDAVAIAGRLLNPNQKGEHGRTALHFACWHKRAQAAVEALLKAGALPNIESDEDGIPLLGAAYRSTPEVVALLLAAGSDIHAQTPEGASVLHCADSRCIPLLVEKGADPNAIDKQGRRPLHTTASRDDPDALVELLKAGAEKDAQDAEGKTALRYAIEEDAMESYAVLLAAGADASLVAKDGLSPKNWKK